MFSIGIIEKNKSKKLYQWDLDRQIKITVLEGIEIDEVHFAHQNDAEALVLEPKDADGALVADIPNILLQSSMPIKAWLMCGDVTVFSDILVPIRRAKPADYVYTETEILRYESLEKRIKALEENGVGGSSETWTTIQDITLEEDVNAIEVTADMDGNAFKVKKMRLTFLGTMTDARLNLFSNPGTTVDTRNMQNTYFYQAFNANSFSRCLVEIDEQMVNGMCKSTCYKDTTAMDGSYALSTYDYCALSTREQKYLDRIKMALSTDKYFTAGTRILIEGVLG